MGGGGTCRVVLAQQIVKAVGCGQLPVYRYAHARTSCIEARQAATCWTPIQSPDPGGRMEHCIQAFNRINCNRQDV